jgi:hypothetical protein
MEVLPCFLSIETGNKSVIAASLPTKPYLPYDPNIVEQVVLIAFPVFPVFFLPAFGCSAERLLV